MHSCASSADSWQGLFQQKSRRGCSQRETDQQLLRLQAIVRRGIVHKAAQLAPMIPAARGCGQRRAAAAAATMTAEAERQQAFGSARPLDCWVAAAD